MNPLWQQKRLRVFCEEKGILIAAYSPLGGPKGTPWGTNQVMQCELLKEIADAKGKTIAQVIFTYTIHLATNNPTHYQELCGWIWTS